MAKIKTGKSIFWSDVEWTLVIQQSMYLRKSGKKFFSNADRSLAIQQILPEDRQRPIVQNGGIGDSFKLQFNRKLSLIWNVPLQSVKFEDNFPKLHQQRNCVSLKEVGEPTQPLPFRPSNDSQLLHELRRIATNVHGTHVQSLTIKGDGREIEITWR